MKKSLTVNILKACTAAFAIASSSKAEATTTNVFDDFNVNLGHFGSTLCTASGQTTNVACTSSSARVTTDSPAEGSGHQRLLINATTPGNNIRIRHLSGGGAVANNVSFTTSAGTDGKIGFYMKTTNTGWLVAINLDGAGGSIAEMDGSTRVPLNSDGAWHLYEWDLDSTTDWGAVPSIGGGHGGSVPNGNHTIDSIYMFNTNGTANSMIFFDFVAVNPNGSVADLLAAPCLNTSGVLPIGPIATNSNQVIVSGVSASASAVTVYQNTGPSGAMVSIGTLTSGILAGNNNVT